MFLSTAILSTKEETHRVGLETSRRCDVGSRILCLHSEEQKKRFCAQTMCLYLLYICVRNEGALSVPFRAEAGVEPSHGKQPFTF